VHAFLAGHRRVLFPDELFADLFPSVPALLAAGHREHPIPPHSLQHV
jgi:hypothetical protein